MKKILPLFSYIFHPVFIPVYATLFYLFSNNSFFINQEKYFVHVSGTLEDIEENDKVTYELERGQKGMNAVRVKKI